MTGQCPQAEDDEGTTSRSETLLGYRRALSALYLLAVRPAAALKTTSLFPLPA